MRNSITVSVLVWVLTPVATLGCGTERWPVKTLADRDHEKLSLRALSPKISELVTIEAPPRAVLDLHEDSRLPTELHTYRVQGWLVGFKKETDDDFHIVLEDLDKRTATLIVEMPAPACVPPFFRHDTDVLREQWEARFGKATAVFKNVRRQRIQVEVTGAGFFDFVHGQTGVAKNGFELHPVFAWKEIVFKPDRKTGEATANFEGGTQWQKTNARS